MTLMSIPKTIQVGPFKFTVLVIDNINEKFAELNPQKDQVIEDSNLLISITYGFVSFKELTIFLSSEQKYGRLSETLFHEVLHVVWSVVGGWAYLDADEERIVSMLSGTLLDTLRRNRELARYLIEYDN